MKSKLFLTACFAAFLLSLSLQSQAQDIFDDKLYLTQSGFYESGDVIPIANESLGLFPSRSILIPITLAEAQRLDLPRAVKTSTRPVVLQYQGNCYQFECDPAAGCDGKCKLVWLDRNEDGKVQAHRELRCVCKPGKICKVKITKANCRK
jgi:hypothetical protein